MRYMECYKETNTTGCEKDCAGIKKKFIKLGRSQQDMKWSEEWVCLWKTSFAMDVGFIKSLAANIFLRKEHIQGKKNNEFKSIKLLKNKVHRHLPRDTLL
ncbi:hypothetical protein GRJ2_001201000 [Grus japonensis]|uniref:Uncharacterized protein n=1 Tax=Grus japonensis TaxID=30415 RepID=A0ABC9WSA5_GRUJA